MSNVTIIGMGHISSALDKINHYIALCMICFVVLVELYCIYLDRNKQTPDEKATILDYRKFYGKRRGWWIFNANRCIASFDTRTTINILINKRWMKPLIWAWNVVRYSIMLCLILLKHVIFKLILNKLFTTTIVLLVSYYIFHTTRNVQTAMFTDTQLPKLLTSIFDSVVFKNKSFGNILQNGDYIDKNVGLSNTDYKLKDFYINACHRPYIIGDDTSNPTTVVFQQIIQAGARYLTFDIYEDLLETENVVLQDLTTAEEPAVSKSMFVPNVRTRYIDKSNGILFDEIIDALVKTKPFGPNKDYPLILHLNFWNQSDTPTTGVKLVQSGFRNKSTYDMVNGILHNAFGDRYGIDGMNPNGAGGGTADNTSIGDIRVSSCNGKVLLVTNDVTQYQGVSIKTPGFTNLSEEYKTTQDGYMNGISRFIYGTVEITLPKTAYLLDGKAPPSRTDPLSTSTHYSKFDIGEGITGGQYSTSITDFIERNKNGLRVIFPEDCVGNSIFIKRHTLFNPRVLDLMNTGCQVILMRYQEMDQELENYHQIFNKTSFILKPQRLRIIPKTSVRVLMQNEAVSFAPKTFSLKGIIDDPIIF